MTSDPAIYDYMSQSKNGEGGIYNITNLNLYHYAGNNPVKYIDPNGMADEDLRDLTDEEKEFVDNAFITAFSNIASLQDKLCDHLKYLNDNTKGVELESSVVDTINQWLGLDMTNTDDVKLVIDNLDSSINAIYGFILAGKNFKYDTKDVYRNKNAYVKVRYNHVLYFGGGLDNFIAGEEFANAPYTLSGTIFHELTHIGFQTVDVEVNGTKAYSRASCLALSDIDKLRSANNWRYAYEDIFSN